MATIVIVDLGSGNLHSVGKAFEHVCAAGGAARKVYVSADPAIIAAAGHLVLPGQGAIGAWIARLKSDAQLQSAVLARLKRGPVLGICVGAQALYARSEEDGGVTGLGLLDGAVQHFAAAHNDCNFRDGKVPHMGWNRVQQRRAHALWDGIADGARFYFAHSYFARGQGRQIAGECAYGNVFTAAAAHNNLFAVQFHPEKSHLAGLRLLQNFINWRGE